MSGNEGTYDEALLLIMERNGCPEETDYTFSYSRVPDDEGEAGGILCANTDHTRRIIGERQLALLRELAAGTGDARSIDDACRLAAGSLLRELREILARAHPDLPVIWISGYPRDAVMEGDTLGDDQVFLQKPVSMEMLLSAAARLTGRDGARGSGGAAAEPRRASRRSRAR